MIIPTFVSSISVYMLRNGNCIQLLLLVQQKYESIKGQWNINEERITSQPISLGLIQKWQAIL